MIGRLLNSFSVGNLFARSSNIRRGAVLALAVIVAWCVLSVPASAVTLFQESFNGYSYFPDEHPANDPVNFGTPITAEGGDNNWYGGRFEQSDSPISGNTLEDIYLDIGVQEIPGGGRPNSDHVGRVADDAGLLVKINTVGFTNVTVSYDWRTFSVDSGDRLVVGYTTLDLDPFFSDFIDSPLSPAADAVATPGGGNVNKIANFYGSPSAGNSNGTTAETWWANNWTQTLRSIGDSWHNDVTFSIPSNSPEIWIAFWMDNGDGDFAKIDDIKITGVVVPEPSSMVIAGLGIVMCGGAALRRRFASKKARVASEA